MSSNWKLLFFCLIIILACIYLANTYYSKSNSYSNLLTRLQEKSKLDSTNILTTTQAYVAPTPNIDLKDKFNFIFNNKVWGQAGGGSGDGSSIEYTTRTRQIIYEVVKKYKINSILDAPCGAMVWMPIVLRNLTASNPKFKYHGLDLVDAVIVKSQQLYTNEFSNWKFTTFDFTQRPLPSDYEMIFSRDALQHLPLLTVVEALKSFSSVKNAKYLLVGTYMNSDRNNKITIGDYFPINLTLHPFNLKTFVEVFKEGVQTGIHQKHLVLYDIPNYLSKIDFDTMKAEALKY